MDIQIHFNVAAELQTLWENCSQGLLVFLDELRAHIGVEGDGIIKFWIADDEHYGTTISAIAPEEGYTDGAGLLGVGKSIGRVNADGSFSGYVIMRECVARRALAEYLGADSDSEPQERLLGKRCQWYILHELGHCKDYIDRNQELKSDTSSDPRFWIENSCKSNIAALADEFAACVLSAKEMSPEVFNAESTAMTTFIAEQLDELTELRKEADETQEKAERIRLKDPPRFFWRILIFYAQLIGCQLGNVRLAEIELEDWNGCNDRSNRILGELYENLEEYWNKYPDWTPETFEYLIILWKALAEANGFKFVHGADGDGVFW